MNVRGRREDTLPISNNFFLNSKETTIVFCCCLNFPALPQNLSVPSPELPKYSIHIFHFISWLLTWGQSIYGLSYIVYNILCIYIIYILFCFIYLKWYSLFVFCVESPMSLYIIFPLSIFLMVLFIKKELLRLFLADTRSSRQ